MVQIILIQLILGVVQLVPTFIPFIGAAIAQMYFLTSFALLIDSYATLCIRENPGCLFIATNRDAVGNMTDLQEWPGYLL